MKGSQVLTGIITVIPVLNAINNISASSHIRVGKRLHPQQFTICETVQLQVARRLDGGSAHWHGRIGISFSALIALYLHQWSMGN